MAKGEFIYLLWETFEDYPHRILQGVFESKIKAQNRRAALIIEANKEADCEIKSLEDFELDTLLVE